jgi:hypothetical protein
MRSCLLLLMLISTASLAGEVKFSDLIRRAPYRQSWNALMEGRRFPKWDSWIPTLAGVEEPVASIDLGGQRHLKSALCQPHNCLDNQVAVIANPRTHRIWMAHREVGPQNRVGITYLGDPDEPMRAALARSFMSP